MKRTTNYVQAGKTRPVTLEGAFRAAVERKLSTLPADSHPATRRFLDTGHPVAAVILETGIVAVTR